MKLIRQFDIRNLLIAACALFTAGLLATSCTSDDVEDVVVDDSPSTDENTPSVVPDFNSTIEPFDTSIRATDSYTPGSDNDIYWQANDFSYDINIVYDGTTATVTPDTYSGVTTSVSGGHVAIDITSETKTRITVSGKTTDGSLKIYSLAKVLLVLDNAEITSSKGPAINCQSKKRLFVEIPESSSNILTDASVYSNDHYYQSGSSASSEDRKGAFFAEGNVIVSGKGLLQINGHYRHALATDGMLRILPGTTLAVTSDGKNGIHAKGSSKAESGITIEGGYIYALCSGDAGKCIKSDMDITIESGILSLNNSSEAIFDTEDNSTSSGAGIKSDANVNISGGVITIKTTGNGAKGISSESNVSISNATVTVTATGKQYVHTLDSSSPAGIKADNNITIGSGEVNVAMYAEDNACNAVKASGKINITNGETYCYAYGNGIYSSSNLQIAGGYIYSLSQRDEAINSKNAIEITGGLVISHSPKAITAATSSILTVSNATVIAAGGRSMTNADSSSSTCKLFSNVDLAAYEPFAVSSESGSPLFAMQFLPSCEGMPLLLASPSFKSGTSWILSTGGSLNTSSNSWNGFFEGVSLTNPSTTTSFSF